MHLALYRKYRPVSFDEVIGQDAITMTLKNQVKSKTISHAYLFTGSRGTGKTTCAKIFSRAINCLSPVDGSPCGKCTVCQGLSQVNNTDILEIDAASNNRVDEIRELRERVKYPAIIGKYKVYIIDEVHMLTDSAFNALLKTLEEPPLNVVFILATTEINKLPATILSRCMKFEFNLVPTAQIAGLIEKIFKQLNISFDSESIDVIATAGDGSVRDGLSIADGVLSFTGGKVTVEDTLKIVGKSSTELLVPLINAIFSCNTKDIFLNIEVLKNSGKSVHVLQKDIATFIKNLILIKNNVHDINYLHITQQQLPILIEIAKNLSLSILNNAFNIITGIELDMKSSLDPQFMLEAACIKAGSAGCKCEHHDKAECDEQQQTVSKPNLKERDIKTVKESIQNTENEQNFDEQTLKTTKESIQNINTKDNSEVISAWGRVLASIREKGLFALSTACKNIYNVELDKDILKLYINDRTSANLLKEKERFEALAQIVKEIFNDSIKISIEYEESKKNSEQVANDLKNLFGKNFRSE